MRKLNIKLIGLCTALTLLTDGKMYDGLRLK